MDIQHQGKKPAPKPTFWSRIFSLNIRGKVILPYFILTLALGVVGTYVVTNLVVGSLDERLTNQLLEAGRVVSDSFARRDSAHQESARIVAFTRDLDLALNSGNQKQVQELAAPAAAAAGKECIIIVDANGISMLHMLKQNGPPKILTQTLNLSELPLVQNLLLADNPPANQVERGIGLHTDGRYYYFTALPIKSGTRVVGVVIVGTSLDTLLPQLKATSLADVVIYQEPGRAIISTFTIGEASQNIGINLENFSVSSQEYNAVIADTQTTRGENIELNLRPYRIARGTLMVRNQVLGAFAVVLPSNYVMQAGVNGRNTYSILFTIAMGGVIFVGYLIAKRITDPLGTLVKTSQAVAEGNFNQRTGIQQRQDEIGMLATTFDWMTECLAERTDALEKLLYTHKETASRLQAILSSIGDGVVLSTPAGRFTPLNTTAENMLKEMQAHQLNPARELAMVVKMDQNSQSQSEWQAEGHRFKIGKKTLSSHASPVRTDEGELLGTVIVLRDITAEVETEELKDTFIAHVSHELRTPLTSIKGYSQLLSTTVDLTPQQKSFMQSITRNTDSLIEMINGLLDFSEVEAHGKLGLQLKPVQLGEIVLDIAQEWRPVLEDKQLKLKVEVPTDLPLVEADVKRLRWAIVNLVRNASQYTPKGEIRLRLSAPNSHVVLAVEDTGIGIEAENQKQLFTRFFRIACNMEEEVRGLGVGLYIARAIVQAHQGEIQVQSTPKKGSTFSVILPVLSTGKEEENHGLDNPSRN